MSVKGLNQTEGKNRFRFQSFNERLKHAKLTATAHVRSQYEFEDPELGNSFFVEELELLKDLDGSAAFRELNQEISPFAQSLQQILFHKDTIVNILVTALDERRGLYDSTLKLLVALSRDLQDEFSVFFIKVIGAILSLLSFKELEALEAVFNALVYIFKYMHQAIGDMFLDTFTLFGVAFNDNRVHVRTFAAEAVAYLFRKLPSESLEDYHSDILESLRSLPSDNKIDGYSRFYFNIIKTRTYLKPAFQDILSPTAEVNDPCHRMMLQAVEMTLHHCKPESGSLIIDEVVDNAKLAVFEGPAENDKAKEPITKAMAFLNLCLYVQYGNLLLDWTPIFDMVEHCAKRFTVEQFPSLTITFGLLLANAPKTMQAKCEKFSKTVFQMDVKSAVVYIEMTKSIKAVVGREFANKFLNHSKDVSKNFDEVLFLLAPSFQPGEDGTSISLETSLTLTANEAGRLHHANIFSQLRRVLSDRKLFKSSGAISDKSSDLGKLWTAITCLASLQVEASDLLPTISELVIYILKELKSSTDTMKDVLLLFASWGLKEIAVKFSKDKLLAELWPSITTIFLNAGARYTFSLEAFCDFLHALVSRGSFTLNQNDFEAIRSVLKPNFSSHEKSLRLNSARIMQTLYSVYAGKKNKSDLAQQLFASLVEFDEHENNPTTSRDKSLCVKKLGQTVLTHQNLPQAIIENILQYLFAFLTEKFAPIIPAVTEALVSVAKRHNHMFWVVFLDVSSKLKDGSEADTLSSKSLENQEGPEYDVFLKGLNRMKALNRSLQATLDGLSDPGSFFAQNLVHSLKAFKTTTTLDTGRYFTILLQIFKSLPKVFIDKSSFFINLLFQASKEYLDDDKHGLEQIENLQELISVGVLKSRDVIFETLSVIKTLDKPQSLHKSEHVYALCLNLLGTGDTAMQRLALDCLFTWKEKPIMEISEQLKGLTDEVKFRDYLTTLDPESLTALTDSDKQKVFAVLIRILFGKLISRRKKSSDRTGLKARRKAIFSFFVKMGDTERELFFQLLVLPFRDQIESESFELGTKSKAEITESRGLQVKYQLGFLNACEDLVKQFQSLATPFIPRLLKVLLFIGSTVNQTHSDEVGEEGDNESVSPEEASSSKSLRQMTIRRVNDLFTAEVSFDFEPYLKDIFSVFIAPKMPNFETENTQAASSLLRLFKTWAENPLYASFLGFSPVIIEKMFQLLAAKAVHISVVELVLGITESLIAHDEGDSQATCMSSLIVPRASFLIEGFRVLSTSDFFKNAARQGKRDVFPRFIELLAQIVTTGVSIENIESISSSLFPYLKRPSQLVPDGIKLRIVEIINQILVQSWEHGAEFSTSSEAYTVFSYLLSNINLQECRRKIVGMFKAFASQDSRITLVSELLDKLNSFELKRLNERDFSKLFDALNAISTEHYASLDSDQWLPILYNLMHLAADEVEFSVRASASHSISKFFESASSKGMDSVMANEVKLLRTVIFPSIKKAFVSRSETVRQEFLAIMGGAVESFPYLDETKCFVPLLAAGDGEANFFNNYYHMQAHRRVRAVHRLTDEINKGDITPNAINSLILPLITHTIFEADRSKDNVLINETISAITASVGFLSWNKFIAYFLKMVGCIEKYSKVERELIRVIVSIVGAIEKVAQRPALLAAKHEQVDEQDNADMEDALDVVPPVAGISNDEKIANGITQRVIPPLLSLLNVKDEENIERRIPLSVSICKALNLLPKKTRDVELSRLLTRLCHFLRNKRQDVRDATRHSLKKIVLDLGPFYFSFIVSELQGSLQRGYQRHVLVYTVHCLLTEIASIFPPGSLDNAIGPLSSLLTDDVFGAIAEEREVTELKGKLIEMKSLKGMECIQILASNVSKDSMVILLRAAKEIMSETNSPKTIVKLKEYFRRISQGLITNLLISPKDLLILIYGLVSENLQLSISAVKKDKPQDKKKPVAIANIFEVQLKRNDPLKQSIDTYQSNSYLFIEFGFSLLLVSLKRGNVALTDENILDMLDPIVDCLAKALYSKYSTVISYSLRCLATVINANLPKLQSLVPIIFKKTVELVFTGMDTDSNGTVEHSAKLMLGILRSYQTVDLSDRQLIELVGLAKGYLENPQAQSVAFSLIKAILQRKYIFAELYDMMDLVAKTLVTSQSREVREKCRSCFVEFLLDYPHGNARLKQLMNYIVHNLNYEFESGRESVLSLVHSIITKFSEGVLYDFADLLFIALVTALVNDDVPKCRAIAAKCISLLLSRIDQGRIEKSMKLVRKWVAGENPALQRAAVHVYGIAFETLKTSAMKFWSDCAEDLARTLALTYSEVQNQIHNEELTEDNEDEGGLTYWECGYLALVAVNKAIDASPMIALEENMHEIWRLCNLLTIHPHRWIRVSICNLFGRYFAIVQEHYPSLQKISASNVAQLNDSVSLASIANQFVNQLQSVYLDEEHAQQIVKNLVFIARCMIAFRESEGEGEQACPPELYRVLRKLSIAARMNSPTLKATPLMQITVFKWFAAILALLPKHRASLTIVINTIVKVLEDDTRKDNEEAKTNGREILDMIHKMIGTSDFVKIMNEVKSNLSDVRDERRSKRKIQAVVDPESYAKRKLRKNELKKESKKRKTSSFTKSSKRAKTDA
ncbi:U3 snoRNP protein [Dinochytrium kinnereticum]|nr:U3 snoRNP protein [Dinochytrium kinnereticum]